MTRIAHKPPDYNHQFDSHQQTIDDLRTEVLRLTQQLQAISAQSVLDTRRHVTLFVAVRAWRDAIDGPDGVAAAEAELRRVLAVMEEER